MSYNGETWLKKTLKDAVYVPKLHTNLFSQTKVLDNGHKLQSTREAVNIYDGENIVAVGARKGSLYKMLFKVIEPENESVANIAIKKCSLRLWHERLGHQNVAHVREYLRKLSIGYINEGFDCDGCAYGKLHRLSFKLREEKATECGQIIRADLCGKLPEISLGGTEYFLLFKDDYSHFRKVYFLKHKSEVFEKIKVFLKWSEKQSGHPVKILRTDNGKEFDNHDVNDYLAQNGIDHEKTVARTPEQNVCVERENRTVMEAARAMIHAKGLSINLWAEAVNSAVYILNRTGTRTVKQKTPYELWFKRTVNIKQFHVFGTKVYVHVPKEVNWMQKPKSVFLSATMNTSRVIVCWTLRHGR